MKRITCEDLALGFACKKVFEADEDDEMLERVLAHAREDHAGDRLDEEEVRAAYRGLGRPGAAN